MPLLAPWRDDELHQNVIEALKRITVANDEHAAALENVDNQYLKSLEHADQESAAQANAVLRSLGKPTRHGREAVTT